MCGGGHPKLVQEACMRVGIHKCTWLLHILFGSSRLVCATLNFLGLGGLCLPHLVIFLLYFFLCALLFNHFGTQEADFRYAFIFGPN